MANVNTDGVPPTGHASLDALEQWQWVGSGSTAEVWVAWEPQFRRLVAVKSYLRPIRDDAGARHFLDECAALGQFSGKAHIVNVISGDFDNQRRPFLIMDHYAKGSLADVLESGPLAPATVTDIGRQIAQALIRVHARGLRHRDVKPANILIGEDDDAALADFGISAEADDLSQSRHYSMTPIHAAPELLLAGGASEAADVWALASTLYTALLGRAPFARREPGPDTEDDLKMRVMADDLPALPPGVPADLVDVLDNALLRDHRTPAGRVPAGRTASAAELDRRLAEVQRTHSWTSTVRALREPVAPFEPEATGIAFGARAGEIEQAPSPTASPRAERGTPSPRDPAVFTGDLTYIGAEGAREPVSPRPRPVDDPPGRRNRKLVVGVGVGAVLVVFAALALYGSSHSPKRDPAQVAGAQRSPAASSGPGASGAPPASVPTRVRAVVKGTTVTVSWSGAPPAGSLGAVVSDGSAPTVATASDHTTITGVSEGTQACYSIAWIVDATADVHYSAPACINGAVPRAKPTS